MTRISSPYLAFYTHVLPLFWIAVCTLLAIMAFCQSDSMAPGLWFLGIGLIGYIGLKFHPPEFSREIWRIGDAIVVRDKNDVTRLELADCVNVTESFRGRRRRVTLAFREPTNEDVQFTFIPHDRKCYLFPLWSMSPFAQDLISSIEAAKRRREIGSVPSADHLKQAG